MKPLPEREKFTTVYVEDFYQWLEFVLSQLLNRHGICSCGQQVNLKERWVFRGQSNADWGLTTSLERFVVDNKAQILTELELRSAETSAIENFQREAAMSYHSKYDEKVEWLGLMQHYGAPTRLLDFTESPLVALYFASRAQFDSDFSVWSLLPSGMNDDYISITKRIVEETVKDVDMSNVVDVFSGPLHDQIKKACKSIAKKKEVAKNLGYTLSQDEINWNLANKLLGRNNHGLPYRSKTPKVVVIYLKQNNARINAQAGLFLMPTVLSMPFWENLRASYPRLEDNSGIYVIKRDSLSNDEILNIGYSSHVIKFVFRKQLRETACRFLDMCNINAKTLFPGLEGIAQSVDYFKNVNIDTFKRYCYQLKDEHVK